MLRERGGHRCAVSRCPRVRLPAPSDRCISWPYGGAARTRRTVREAVESGATSAGGCRCREPGDSSSSPQAEKRPVIPWAATEHVASLSVVRTAPSANDGRGAAFPSYLQRP